MVVACGLLGVLVGTMINWTADQQLRPGRDWRLPSCPYCDTTRPPWAWISLIAYLRWQPDCRNCSAPISLRHLALELGTAILFAFLCQRYGPTPHLLLYCLYSSLLMLIALVDFEYQIIPYAIILPGLLVALVGSIALPSVLPCHSALLGGAAGFALLFLAYLGGRLFAGALRRHHGFVGFQTAFGFGDVLLGALVGLILGVPWVALAVLLAILLGGLGALTYLLAGRARRGSYSPYAAIPYGPFLVLGALIALFFGPDIASLPLAG